MDFEKISENGEKRIKKIILEFIELDADILLHKDLLIEGVEGINFREEDAFDILTKLIETYSTNTESRLEVIEVHNTDIEMGKGVVNEYTTQNLKTHEDVELLLEEPWRSSALRKLWKAISSIEFKDMLDEGMTQSVAQVLEIVLLVADEDGYVPVSFDDYYEQIKDKSPSAVE